MPSSQRIFQLTILSYLMYSFSIFISHGELIFPTPLNSAFFLVFIVAYIFGEQELFPLEKTTWLGIALTALFSQDFIYELILNPLQLEALDKSLLKDVILIIHSALLLTILTWQATKSINIYRILLLISGLFLLLGIALNSYWIQAISLLAVGIISSIRHTKTYEAFPWLLLGVFSACSWWNYG